MQPDKHPQHPWQRYGLLLLGMGLAGLAISQFKPNFLASASSEQRSLPEPAPTPAPVSQPARPVYERHVLPQATIHTVSVPAGMPVSVAVADSLATVETFARQETAIAAINGGFFDPQNGQTTSHLTTRGQPAGDPADNERLAGNPALQTYLDRIFNRSEFRSYRCQGQASLHYDIVFHNAPLPDGCRLESALGAGPQLLPVSTVREEAFTDYENGELIRDAIGAASPNARSAIALRSDGTVLLLMAAQRSGSDRPTASEIAAPGMTLAELAEFAASLGATQLLNLDGGSSAALYYTGRIYLGRFDADGNPIERPVKSVILVGQ